MSQSTNNTKEYKCPIDEKNYKLIFSQADTIIEERSLGELLEDLERNYIIDNISMQRDSGQWSAKDMSLLIHTVLIGLSIYPISLDQSGTGGGSIRRLTDGKQRLNVFESYKNNEFSLSKVCPPVTVECVETTPLLSEDGTPVKENRKVVMVPVLDENGNQVIKTKTYKVAGKRFSQLPDDLQYQFLRYKKMKQLIHINYTEEETKLQMLRDNTSAKMNPAQIGIVVSGEDLASWLKQFREKELFLNHSTWTLNDKKKSAIERCIVESTILAYASEKWQPNYAKNNELFISDECKNERNALSDIIDDLNEIIVKFPELWDKLDRNNMHIIIAAYCHFSDNKGKRYNDDDFGRFLCAWFDHIKDTVDYEVEGNTGTKQKTTVLKKLSIIDEECMKYMEEFGTECKFGDIDAEGAEEGESTEDTNESSLDDFVENFGTEKTEAICALMELDNRSSCRDDFTLENINKYEEFFRANPSQKIIDRCLEIQDKILNIPMEDGTIINKYNFPIVVKLYHNYVSDDNEAQCFMKWLKLFDDAEEPAFAEIGGKIFADYTVESVDQTSNATIICKYAVLQESLERYIKSQVSEVA